MKKTYARLLFLALGVFMHTNQSAYAQCGVGYTQAQVNWDKLDYYFNATKPYSSYVTNAMEQTQKFALGPNYVSLVTSSSALINPGTADGVSVENTSHTGELTGYTGADVQYNPSANGQTLTMTFNDEVTNLSFTLYDVDASQRIDVDATDASSTAINVSMGVQASTILTISNNNSTSAYVTASGSTVGNSSNQGSVTITIAGPVKEVVITFTTIGSDVVCWLSDLTACVTGSFPSQYNQTPNNEPFQGPAGDQPDYFLLTPDNDYCYMVDPVTGVARPLFQDASKDFLNSFAYDPYNHYLYYISENATIDPNNKAIKRYDFNTNTSTTVLADISSLNIPVLDQGIETAGAAFYNGNLFIGLEGGRYNSSNTRESIVYRLDLDGSGIPVNAVQVFAVNSYNGGTGTHDWADFVIEDGVLVNYNSRSGTTMVAYEHYDMMTGQSTQYLNPYSGTGNAYQAGLTWTGEQYSFSSQAIRRYFEDGTVGSPVNLTHVGGGVFTSGAGDASENFRPKCDFGDAPSSYDPVANSPAVHERSDNLRLGSTWDDEWVKTGGAGATLDGGDEDGIATVPVLDTGYFNYAIEVDVYNNTGANATLSGWLDYNGNGVYDPAEGVTATVSSSASTQTVTLVWWVINTPLTIGQSTYLRVRITSADKGMGTDHPTGYYDVGEVEDYEVMVDLVLPVNLIQFETRSLNEKVELNWKTSDENQLGHYEIERSQDKINWVAIGRVKANNLSGTQEYQFIDEQPVGGASYYRLRITRLADGSTEKYSSVRRVEIKSETGMTIHPNPFTDYINIEIQAINSGRAQIKLLSLQGSLLSEWSVELKAGNNQIQLSDLSKYAPSSYLLQVITPDGIISRQIFKK